MVCIKLSVSQVFQILVTLACVFICLLITVGQYKEYVTEPTGSSFKQKSVDNLAFPALSICDSHYENAKAIKELGITVSPFQKPENIGEV
jgi:hypothetical protein